MLLTLLLALLVLPLPVQVDPEEAYRQDYARYTEISQMTDVAAQADSYLAFAEEGFDERLLGSVLGGLQDGMGALTQAGDYDKVYEVADAWTAWRAEDPQPVALALQAAMAQQNAEQTVKYGETFYAAQPSAQVALVLAQSYSQLGNDAKIMEFGQVAVDELPIDQTWSIAYAMLGQHAAAPRWSEAGELASKIQAGLASAPEGVSADQWRDIRLFLQDTIARDAYEAGRYAEAVQGYNAVLDIDPRSDKAYYFIADSQLKTNQIADSMNAFAKSSLLNGGYSARARDMLETIYGANTGGNLEGLEETVVSRARRELGNP